MEDRLTILLGRFVQDLGATISAGNVLIGDELGLYRAMAEAGPLTPAELAAYTGTAERYVREWLPGQAAGGYVSYDATADRYWLDEAQAVAFADPDGLLLPGAYQLALACLADRATVQDAFRTGQGVPWGAPTTPASTSAASASTAPATCRTWSAPGSPRCPGWPSGSPTASRSPTSAAAMATRRC